MSSSLEFEARSHVLAPEDIDSQLTRLLESHHFRHSQRYPALLKHLVQQTQIGNTSRLKERLLGIEVFHRPPDYDTSLDPVVRVTAGEVRKRIAQYYQEPEHTAELRIELPIGSYVPRFLPARIALQPADKGNASTGSTYQIETRSPEHIELAAVPDAPHTEVREAAEPALANAPSASSLSRLTQEPSGPPIAVVTGLGQAKPTPFANFCHKHNLLLVTLALLLGACLASGAFLSRSLVTAGQTRALRELWAPMQAGVTPLLFVVGDHSLDDQGRPMGIAPVNQSGDDTVLTQMNRRSQVPFDDTVSLDKIHSFFNRDNRPYQDKGAGEATLGDLRGSPVVLFAGFDNRWTVHLSQQLRFRLLPDLDNNRASIVDAKDPTRRWTVNFAEPIDQIASDYGVVARYFDPLLEQNVMLVAGVGSMGTAAASEFVTQERFAREIVSTAPRGWKAGNFEVVLSTPVVDGHAGPPRIVASAYW